MSISVCGATGVARDPQDAQAPTTTILRPILIRSLSRQRANENGQVLQVVSPPPATVLPARRGAVRRVLEVKPRPTAPGTPADKSAEAETERVARQCNVSSGEKSPTASVATFLSPASHHQQHAGQSCFVAGAGFRRLSVESSVEPGERVATFLSRVSHQQHAGRSHVVTGAASRSLSVESSIETGEREEDDAYLTAAHGSSTTATPLKLEHSEPPTTTIGDEQRHARHRCCVEGMLTTYAEALEAKPLMLKCITSAVVGAIGDILAQALSWAVLGNGNAPWHDIQAMRQTLAVAIDGFCVNAPFLHIAYAGLDRWIPAHKSTAFALAQVLVDVLIFSPIYALAFIVTTGFLEGKSVSKEILPTIREDYATLVFWLVVFGLILAPPHIYLFNRFSVKWRVLISDGIDLLWTTIACFVIEPK